MKRENLAGFFDDAVESSQPSYPKLSALSAIEHVYTDHELIGEGGLKQVFRCYDHRSQREIAYARVRDGLAPRYYEQFIYEGQLTASLDHPNIIKIHEIGVEDERPYYTMDLKKELDLYRYIEVRELDLKARLQIYARVLYALSYAHSQGVLHLDLKPDNILCSNYGEVIVCDWGSGKMVEGEEDDVQRELQALSRPITLTGKIKGTPGFMAPEQITGDDKDHRTDVFSLGALLYFLLSGEPPFSGDDHEQIFEQTLSSDRPLAYRVLGRRKSSRSLSLVAAKAMALAPEDRYQSVAEIQQELDRYLAGYSTEVEQASWGKKVYRWGLRHPLVVKGAAVSLVTIFLLCQYFFSVTKTQQEGLQVQSEAIDQLETDLDKEEKRIDTMQKQMIVRSALHQSHRALQCEESLSNKDYFSSFARFARSARASQKYFGDRQDVSMLMKSVYFIEMNFAELIALQERCPEPEFPLMEYVNQFPHYQFDSKIRPTVAEVSALIEAMDHVHEEEGLSFLEAALRYVISAPKKQLGDYAPIMIALHRYLGCDMTYDYDPEASVLVGRSSGRFGDNPEMYNCRRFSYANVDTLRLEIAEGLFRTQSLEDATVKTLDLSGVNQIAFFEPVTVHGLERVIIASGKYPIEEVARTFKIPVEWVQFRNPAQNDTL